MSTIDTFQVQAIYIYDEWFTLGGFFASLGGGMGWVGVNLLYDDDEQ